MNRKATILAIAFISAILPAVAVADVMITGQLTLEGGSHAGAFVFQPGPNYAKANATNSFGWTPFKNSIEMGNVDLEGNFNTTTYLANVLDMNTSISHSTTSASSTQLIYLNVTQASLPAWMIISTHKQSLGNLSTVTLSTGNPIYLNGGHSAGGIGTGLVAVSLTGDSHIIVNNFSDTETFYFSFILFPGVYAGHGAMLTGQFVATGS